MILLGRALARLARSTGGQLLLELPDDLNPDWVAQLVVGANAGTPAAAQPFALFVADGTAVPKHACPTCDFRELAMYRQDSRLAITFTKYYDAKATFASVYPLLLSKGFPHANSSSRTRGVATLTDLSNATAEVLYEDGLSQGLDLEALRATLGHIMVFLAEAHGLEGNRSRTSSAQWWEHMCTWTTALALPVPQDAPAGVHRIYGCAGLPAPTGASPTLRMSPAEYVKLINTRWATPESIAGELGRLATLAPAKSAVEKLSTVNWSDLVCHGESVSALTQLAAQSGPTLASRASGWSLMPEDVFARSFADAKGRMQVLQAGVPLLVPQAGVPPLLRLRKEEEIQVAPEWDACVTDITLVIPAREGVDQMPAPMDVEDAKGRFVVSGGPGSKVAFAPTAITQADDCVHLTGTLCLRPAEEFRRTVTLNVAVQAALQAGLVDRCSAVVSLLGSGETVVYAKHCQRSTKRAARGPIYAAPAEDETPTLDVVEPGTYVVKCVTGLELVGSRTSSFRVGQATLVCDEQVDGVYSAEVAVKDSVLLSCGDTPICEIRVRDGAGVPISPMHAAAHGVQPNTKANIDPCALSSLEQLFSSMLEALDGRSALGCVLVADCSDRSEWGAPMPGVACASGLLSRVSELTPGLPTPALLNHRAYGVLRDAYMSLGWAAWLSTYEEQDATAGLTVSRVRVDSLPQAQVQAILEAWHELLAHLDEFDPADRFWAQHPFAVAVYPSAVGAVELSALLLSPLHPLRLAWAHGLQAQLHAAFEDGASPTLSLSLLDGTHFPAFCHYQDGFGDPRALFATAIDAGPDSVYLGWHVSVATDSAGKICVPQWLDGWPFPVDGLSALSPSSVERAIEDFIRVYPQVSFLTISIESLGRARRSAGIDQGLLNCVSLFADDSSAVAGVAGVDIQDSTNRLGPVPSLARLAECLPRARQGFNVQWRRGPAGLLRNSHVKILEGSAAKVSLQRATGARRGWLPRMLLQRTPARTRAGQVITLDWAARDSVSGEDLVKQALFRYETRDRSCHFTARIRPNLVSSHERPVWLVMGDFGADPQALSLAAQQGSSTDYLLWDWRPASATRAGEHSGRLQPYFVVAAIPSALSSAIRDRIGLLLEQASPEEITRRGRILIERLASRAIGLNCLLAAGHHQATGALGFYFALHGLSHWLSAGGPTEVRMVVPVDAVDPFLRAGSMAAREQGRGRADLLIVRGARRSDGSYRVCLAPVEIKHYGLTGAGLGGLFPTPPDTILDEPHEQLRNYQQKVVDYCSDFEDVAGPLAEIMAERLVALLDAAAQLNGESPQDASPLLSAISAGKFDLEPGHGVFLWYQAKATGSGGSRAEWEYVAGSPGYGRVDVRIDPTAFDACYWSGAEGLCHDVLRMALDEATKCDEAPVIPLVPPVSPERADRPSAAGGDQARSLDKRKVGPPEPAGASTPADSSGHPAPTSPRPSAPPDTVPGPDPAAMPPKNAPEGACQRLPMSELERRYGVLLSALDEFRVKVRRPEGTPYREGPGFIEYAVVPGNGVAVNKVESQIDNIKLRLRLPNDASVSCVTHLGSVLITVPKAESERYYVDAEALWQRWQPHSASLVVPLGEDIAGDVVELDLSDANSPHVLLAGVTGSGKSEALLTILHGLIRIYPPEMLKLLLVDPKRTELTSLQGKPHLRGQVGCTPQHAVAALSQAVAEMEARYKAFSDAGSGIRSIKDYQASGREMARWIVVLDEYADLISEDRDRVAIEAYIKRLSQKARAAGIHLILSTQKPVVDVVNTVIKGNLPARIALRVNTATESRVILDKSGAEHLVGKGDALLEVGNSVKRLQFARYKLPRTQ